MTRSSFEPHVQGKRVLGTLTVLNVSSDGRATYKVINPEVHTIKLTCGCYIRWAMDADKYRYCPVCGKRISHV